MNVFALKVINCNMCSDAGESNVWFITLVSVPVHMTCWPFICISGGRRANSRSVQGRRLVRNGLSLDSLYQECLLRNVNSLGNKSP